MIIKSFGLFWQRSEVEWAPGRGKKNEFRLLGRQNRNAGALRLADFREQRGIYVLYDDYGPNYVGLANELAIGTRLKHHTTDRHSDSWDRFSWFGFRRVLKGCDGDGLRNLGKVPKTLVTNSESAIRDIEALLIMSLGTHTRGNINQMQFAAATHWLQVQHHEIEMYVEKARRG